MGIILQIVVKRQEISGILGHKSEKKGREKIISEAKKYTVPLECWGKN